MKHYYALGGSFAQVYMAKQKSIISFQVPLGATDSHSHTSAAEQPSKLFIFQQFSPFSFLFLLFDFFLVSFIFFVWSLWLFNVGSFLNVWNFHFVECILVACVGCSLEISIHNAAKVNFPPVKINCLPKKIICQYFVHVCCIYGYGNFMLFCLVPESCIHNLCFKWYLNICASTSTEL